MLTLNPAKLPSPQMCLQIQCLLQVRTVRIPGTLLSMQHPSAPDYSNTTQRRKSVQFQYPARPHKSSFSIDFKCKRFPPAPPSKEPAAHSVLCSSYSLRSKFTFCSRAHRGTSWADSTLHPLESQDMEVPRPWGSLCRPEELVSSSNKGNHSSHRTCCLQVHGNKSCHSSVFIHLVPISLMSDKRKLGKS